MIKSKDFGHSVFSYTSGTLITGLMLVSFQNCSPFQPFAAVSDEPASLRRLASEKGWEGSSMCSSYSDGEVSRISTSGSIELVWDWEAYHDPSGQTFTSANGNSNTFDGPPHFYKDASGNLFAIAANGVNYRVPFNADFTPQRALTSADRIFDSSQTVMADDGRYFHKGYGSGYLSGSCDEADYDNVMWIFGLWSSDGKNFSALAHHEFYPRDCPIGTTTPWVNGVHHLVSSDNGASFLPKAYTPYANSGKSNSDRLVLTPQPFQTSYGSKITYGFYHPSNIVNEGSYYYAITTAQVYLGTTNSAGEALVDGGFAMIRTKTPDQSTGWEAYTESGWQVRDTNTFQGQGGQEVKLFHKQSSYSPYSEYARGGQLMSYSLVQHACTGKWIALGYSNQGSTTIQYTVTSSLETPDWGQIKPVEGAPVLPMNGYPILASHNSSGYVFQYVDDKPYLYFIASNDSPAVPAGVGKSVTNAHSRSIWRVGLSIEVGGATATNPLVFDVNFYRNYYADLSNFSDAQLEFHWLNYGISEGRRAHLNFSASEYLTLYSDLSKGYGATNYASAISHYVTAGQPIEHRQGSILTNSLVYDSATYRNLNSDLSNMTDAQLGVHWLNYGISEGRRAHLNFSASEYLTLYSDLSKGYGATNYGSAILHYVTHGFAEGRSGRITSQ